MNIVIISDIHDNLVNLKKCLDWCGQNKVEKIICCGDVTNIETIEFLSKSFLGEIFLIRGNADNYQDQEIETFKNIKHFGRISRVELAGKFIGFCHEPFLIDKVKKLGECDIVFYGHTHKPWIEYQDKTAVINPGTLGGMFQKATFAFWDTEKIEPELKILEMI